MVGRVDIFCTSYYAYATWQCSHRREERSMQANQILLALGVMFLIAVTAALNIVVDALSRRIRSRLRLKTTLDNG